MKNDRATLETASAAMNAALTTPIIGMFSGTAIVDGPDGPVDLNAIHTGISLLQQIADRTASFSGRRSGETPFRVVLAGRRMGRMRIRSVVQEEDRLKLYGVGLILPDDMVVCAEPMTSGSGRHFGVRFHTNGGTLEVSTAPGMKPGRRPRA